MGSGQSQKKDFKKIYLENVKIKKKEYFDRRKEFITIRDFSHWKDLILSEINEVKKKFPVSRWPYELIKFCETWNSINDNSFQWNMIWYDYLRITSTDDFVINGLKSKFNTNHLKEPLNCFEVDNIYQFLHTQFSNSSNNLIGGIISIFNHSFYTQNFEKIGKQNSEFSGDGNFESDLIRNAFFEMKEFIVLTIKVLINYYGGLLIEKINESPGEIYDFMLEETFLEPCHSVILSCFLKGNLEKEKKYLKNLEKFQYITCADLGIKKVFQLDHNLSGLGYLKAVNKLKELDSVFSPNKKLQIVYGTSRLICECIDDDWINASEKSSKELVIDADQILSIFTYVVIKAKIKNLRGHIGIIKEFIRFSQCNESVGYYVVTIEACIEQIENFEKLGNVTIQLN